MQPSTHQKAISTVSFTLRTVQPGDADALSALIESLSGEERRWRFHGTMNGVCKQTLKRLTCVDSVEHVAYVVHAQGECGTALIADGRFALDDHSGRSEIALMVAPQWRRRGIGRLLTNALMRAASQISVRALHGTVMLENIAMQQLLYYSGFECESRAHVAGLLRYAATLSPELITLQPCASDRRVSRRVPTLISSPWTVRRSLRGLEV
ncbi:MAG: GNAT family N-acetyltransferase [Burkholderiaceae bacterium]